MVALVFWVTFAGLLAYVLLRADAARHAEADERLRDAARSVAVALDTRLGVYIAGLDTLAASGTLDGASDIAAFLPQARAAGEVLAGTIMLRGPLPEAAVLANTASRPDLVSGLVEAGAFQPALQESMARLYAEHRPSVSDLFQSPLRASPLVVVAVPVLREGQPLRRLSLSIDADALRGQIERLEPPPGTLVVLRDGQFQAVATSGGTAGSGDAEALAWLRSAMAGRESGLLTGTNPRGEAVVVAAERLRTEPRWMVTVSEELAGRDSALVPVLLLPGIGILVLLLGIIAAAWAAGRDRAARAAEEAARLREAQAEVERLHARLPAVIYLREVPADGTPGRLVYRAGDVEGVLGWPASVIADRPLREFAEFPDRIEAAYRASAEQEEQALEYRFRQPDGGWRWIRASGRRLDRLPNGNFLVVGYMVDITAERAAQAQLQAARRLAGLADMAHGLAHELKQPLQVISLSAETAKALLGQASGAPDLAPEIRTMLARAGGSLEGIIQQALRTGSVIDHLRRFARGSAEGGPSVPVRLDAAVEGALLLVQHGLRRAGIELEVALGDPPPTVLGQRIAVEQILVNLLNNARDAFEEQPPGTPRRIRIAAEIDGAARQAVLTVADTAGGISPRVLDRLFEPFASTKSMEAGTGLGLAICRGLAAGMDGAITGENAGEGALFALRLPLAPVVVEPPVEAVPEPA